MWLPPRLRGIRTLSWGLVLGLLQLVGAAAARSDENARPPVDFAREIRPILAKNCFPCHGPDAESRKAELRLDRRDDALRDRDGHAAIVPDDPDASELVFRITEEDETVRMPPKKAGARLTPEQIDLIGRWISEGAPYSEHWAFVPPADRTLPQFHDRAWPRDGIDAFILARLEREGMAPSEGADRYTLLRRASLDLRGLPPSPEEIAAFAADTSPDAYERAVDRFLADPAFGERWARMWLDLARYADSAGFGSDPLRPDIWRYRDWVIDALNRNLPFDRFTVEQLAGDLLPDPTLEQRVATAFHRNTMTNTEGGTDDEEFRVAAIKDRIDTTAQVWMGLTMGCAKCHTHKYDPISHEEYYRFYAIFNQSADTDQPDEGPTIPAPTPTQEAEIRRVEALIADLRVKLDTPTTELAADQARWESEFARQPEWTTIEPCDVKAESMASLESLPDGSIRASGPSEPTETYTLSTELAAKGLIAYRLDAIPDPEYPGGGSGRAADGNFVLSHFAVEAEPASSAGTIPAGKFVRIELPGEGKILSLAEVQVFRDGQNVAAGGKARQSSTDYEGPAERAIDGNTDGHFFDARSTTHTGTESNPWWEVELAEAGPVERIAIWNRTDGGTGYRLANYRVSVLDAERKVAWEGQVAESPSPSLELTPSGRRPIKLAKAAADFDQEGFSAADSLKPAKKDKGWAVAPKQAEPHAIVFVGDKPLEMEGPTRLTFRLEHRFRDPGYALGRFRVSVSRDPIAVKRAEVPPAILAILDTPAENRSGEQRDELAKHYRSIAPSLQSIRDEVARLEKAKPVPPKIPVMVELSVDKRRETHLMNKGNFLDPGMKVEPGIPAAFKFGSEEAPTDRLGTARWLVDPRNPLTARVAVNRIWGRVFGIGLVETEEDFGTQGDLPTHPELLDWLAIRYVESGWDTKALLRRLVTSATYRQSSKIGPEALAKDPRNRLLGRSPRYRLEAELVRDQALALAGLLSRKVGGPSVFPPQPDGLWQAAFNGQRTWSTSEGADRYRRGLYTFWRRTVPYPSMAAFDAPSRELCTIRRPRSNNPLQAFVTLNDPVYVEAAQALARRIAREGGSEVEGRARYGLMLCLGRPASDSEVTVLVDLFRAELERFRGDLEAAEALATDPLGPLPAGSDAAEMAAWTAVANVLLNLDGVLTKG